MKLETRLTLLALLGLTLMAGTVALAWDVSVNGRPGSDFDEGMAVGVDPQTGSVFVAGQRQTSATESSFIIVKYSATGTKEWQHAIPGAAFAATGGASVAVDADGFVFAAGTIFNGGEGDLVIVKLDGRSPKKSVLWTRTVDVFGSTDAVNTMALTPDGGVAVAAIAFGGSGISDGYLMKFTAAGEDAWPAAQILSGTSLEGFNAAMAVGILPGGDVAVAGTLANTGTNHDAIVARFDGATGERRWIAAINDVQFNGDDFGRAISIAANGDIVAAGTMATRSGFRDFAVFRFDGAGTLRWRRIIDRGFSDQALAVAVTPDDDVIAAGGLGTPTGPNNSIFYVVKLRGSDGVPLWQYEEPGPSDFLEARSLVFDSAGNPVVTGVGTAAVGLSAFTVLALSRDDGSVIWKLPLIGTAPLVNHGNAVAFNPTTSAVIAVGVTQNRRTSFDLTVVQIRDGREDWRQVINGRGKRVDRDDGAVALAADPRNGGIAIAGYAQNTGTDVLGTVHDFKLVKIGRGGDVDWTYDFNDPLPHVQNTALAVAVSERGQVFGAGRTCYTSITSCFTVVRVGQRGKEIWRTIIRGDAPGRAEARAIVVDPDDGNVVVAGDVQLAGSGWAVLKLDAKTGAVLWSAPMPGGRFPGGPNGLALTSRHTVAVAAATVSGAGVIELDMSTGEVRSSGLRVGFSPSHVAFDAREGTVVVAGTLVQNNFTRRMTVAKFDDVGNLVWSTSVGDVLGAGSFIGGLAVDKHTGAVAIAGSSAVVRLNPDGSEAWRRSPVAFLSGAVATNSVTFASDRIITVGQITEGTRMMMAVLAVDAHGVEAWRRTFPGNVNVWQRLGVGGDSRPRSGRDFCGWHRCQRSDRP